MVRYLQYLPDFDFVAAGAFMFHKHMSSCDEISGGGGILHWGEISGGKSYSETLKGENLALG